MRDAHRRRHDDRHRAGRRHRAERPAHGARQAQRARPRAGRADRRGSSATRWSRRCVAYVPEGDVDPPGGHMRFAGTISIPAAAFEARARRRGAQLRAAGFRDIVLIGDHGGYQAEPGAVRRRSSNREWAATAGARALHRRLLPRDQTPYRRRRCASAAYRRADRHHAGRADTSLTLAVDPRWCAPTGSRGARRRGRRRRRRPAPRERRARPARRRPDRRRRRVDGDPHGAPRDNRR